MGAIVRLAVLIASGLLATATASAPVSTTPTANKLAPKKRKAVRPVNTTMLPTQKERASPPVAASASPSCNVKVFGVGGGGGNAVSRMSSIKNVEFWAINTDSQALEESTVPNRMVIGKGVTRGLGAGGQPLVGQEAASESVDDVSAAIGDADLCFITGGMGGGTGSGAAPVIASAARSRGALTVGVVTTPFHFEGRRRMDQAVNAIRELQGEVDTLIVVSNEKLLSTVPESTTVADAFLVADDVLRQGIEGISDIILKPGVINVDFADVKAIMSQGGAALMGIGTGKGPTRAADAARAAITSPLLDFPIDRAKGIVFNIVGGSDLTLQEINAAAEVIYEAVDPEANIIFGAVLSDRVQQEVQITVLATGFDLTQVELLQASSVAAAAPSALPTTAMSRTLMAQAASSTDNRQKPQTSNGILPSFLPRLYGKQPTENNDR